jgi:alkanesulfonate monooxygenase SsuD/methylene tetrahydromethanopterin reductase-like flavin-dependent oxidoreductase (luciferase family)
MPTVLRVAGFRVVIFLPPREHKPPHVHVRNADGEVVIVLPVPGGAPAVREVAGMRADDVVRAFWIVEEHAEYLLERWREYHG